MSFIEKVMGVSDQVGDIMLIAILLATPFFVFFGWLSDKIGRKWIMMGGMLIAILAYRPIYEKMYQTSNIENKQEITEKATLLVEIKENKAKDGFDSVYTSTKEFTDGTQWKEVKTINLDAQNLPIIVDGKAKSESKISKILNDSDRWTIIFMVFIQIFFVTMVYGPIAAFLVEMFPAKIRYTSMSLPYHIGNGIFGGLLPAIATSLVASATKLGMPQAYLSGLWYPIVIAGISLIIGVIYLDGKDNDIHD